MTGECDGASRGGAGVWSRYSANWGMFTRSSLRRLVVPCVHDHVFGPLARKPFGCLITVVVSLTAVNETRPSGQAKVAAKPRCRGTTAGTGSGLGDRFVAEGPAGMVATRGTSVRSGLLMVSRSVSFVACPLTDILGSVTSRGLPGE